MTLSPEMIHEKVKRVLIEEFELEENDLTPDANLYDDLELDSLDGVDLVVALEKEFDFKISREQDEERIRGWLARKKVVGWEKHEKIDGKIC